ncbi:hypothetical protein G9A89_008863 [Geosiphon pyriformis]|nr:hypothetical protein G9A89_008863 [Geosiphon pyriformis]
MEKDNFETIQAEIDFLREALEQKAVQADILFGELFNLRAKYDQQCREIAVLHLDCLELREKLLQQQKKSDSNLLIQKPAILERTLLSVDKKGFSPQKISPNSRIIRPCLIKPQIGSMNKPDQKTIKRIKLSPRPETHDYFRKFPSSTSNIHSINGSKPTIISSGVSLNRPTVKVLRGNAAISSSHIPVLPPKFLSQKNKLVETNDNSYDEAKSEKPSSSSTSADENEKTYVAHCSSPEAQLDYGDDE